MIARALGALVLLSFGAACAGGSGEKSVPGGFGPPLPPIGPPTQPTDPPPPAGGGACADVYDPDHLPTFEVDIASDHLEALIEEQKAGIQVFHPAVFRYEGEEYPDAMVRYRGNKSTCGDKLQIAIAFHKVNPDGRFHGLRRINLDHGSCGTIEERLALAFVRDELGVEASCANNARLVLNGHYYGLYTNIEHIDREFLERNFDDPDGNLYEDAREEWKKTNEDDPDTSDMEALNGAADAAAVDALSDLDQAMRMWAGDALLPGCDNYWYFGRNFYVYNHPSRGFLFLPTDYDHALPLGWCSDWMLMPSEDKTAALVLQDPEWRAKFVDELAAAHARFRPEWFDERIDRWWLQVRESAEADPFLAGEIDDFSGLKQRIREREALIRAWLEEGAHDVSE